MQGRSANNPVRNGFNPGSSGVGDRQIRSRICQENLLRRDWVPVPQTDTGGRDEYSQALG
jgi:hypothetical protein